MNKMIESESAGVNEKPCIECNMPIRKNAEICPKCGVRQFVPATAKKFCTDCGESISTNAEVCPKCGARQYTASNPNRKSKVTAALLAFFLGGFGAHKFYLGKIGQGILYLLFFWTLIPGFIAFIEFIIYLSMSDEAFDSKYN